VGNDQHNENKQEILRVRDKVDDINVNMAEVKTKLEILIESSNKILAGVMTSSDCEMKGKLLKQEIDYKIETVSNELARTAAKRKDTRTTVISITVSCGLLIIKELTGTIF